MRLKEIRTAKGLSQYRLAKITGITQTYISKMERNDQKSAGYEVLKKLSLALGVSIEELMESKETA